MSNPANNLSPDRRPAAWAQVPPEQWNDWRWQLTHRLNTREELAKTIRLTQAEEVGLSTSGLFRVDITPYVASLIDPDDPACPIRQQVIPTAQELEPFEAAMVDSLGEEHHSPVPGLVHRYPDRVLMLVTTQCASYCRFCTRSRIVGDPGAQFSPRDHERQLSYIAATPQIRDVLLSGGDPLILPQAALERLLRGLRSIPHVEIVRIGTRVPFFLPQRITDDLVAMLRQYHPLWINMHFNHPSEITPEVERALARMADAGIPLGAQTVLMAGVNDCPNILLALMHKLVRNRVRPYYLYQCDLVQGAGHFRTPVSKGIEIMESLRGHTSGYAIPTFVVDAPMGGGKVPLSPNYLLSMSEKRVVVRNYEGMISAYTQPTSYQSHKAHSCAYCQAHAQGREHVADRDESHNIAELLAGEALAITPEGWQATHVRGASELAGSNRQPSSATSEAVQHVTVPLSSEGFKEVV